MKSVKATIQGENIDYDGVEEVIKNFGAAIHSIDEVVVGKNFGIWISAFRKRFDRYMVCS